MTKKTLKYYRDKADKLCFQKYLKPRCEVCGKKAVHLHHIFPKGLYGHLRYTPDNLASLCFKCHFRHHHRADPSIHDTIIAKRGKKWYKYLQSLAINPPKNYKQSVKWYKFNIEVLEKNGEDY